MCLHERKDGYMTGQICPKAKYDLNSCLALTFFKSGSRPLRKEKHNSLLCFQSLLEDVHVFHYIQDYV